MQGVEGAKGEREQRGNRTDRTISSGWTWPPLVEGGGSGYSPYLPSSSLCATIPASGHPVPEGDQWVFHLQNTEEEAGRVPKACGK